MNHDSDARIRDDGTTEEIETLDDAFADEALDQPLGDNCRSYSSWLSLRSRW